MKILLVAAAAAGLVWYAAQERPGDLAQTITAVKATEVKWEKAEGLPEGVMLASIQGDMKKGPFLTLLKFPAGTKIPLHWHNANGGVAVVSGTMVIGQEGRPEIGKGMEVSEGGYFKVPAKTHHWSWAKTEVVFAYFGDMAHDIHYVEGKGNGEAEEPK